VTSEGFRGDREKSAVARRAGTAQSSLSRKNILVPGVSARELRKVRSNGGPPKMGGRGRASSARMMKGKTTGKYLSAHLKRKPRLGGLLKELM